MFISTVDTNFRLIFGQKSSVKPTLGARGFFSLGATELNGEAAKESREAARKKPLAPTDNNLTSMSTPVSFD